MTANQTFSLAVTAVTMTSREVAELAGKEHFHVMRDVRTMLGELSLVEAGYIQNWRRPRPASEVPARFMNNPAARCSMGKPGLTASTGLAMDADGKLLDMPRELAHWVTGQLLDVITLLHSLNLQTDSGGDDDRDGSTSADFRATALLNMADEKAREMLDAIGPYAICLRQC